MKSNVYRDGDGLLIYKHCQTCNAQRMGGGEPEFFCGAKERIEGGRVFLVAPCPRNRPLPVR